eukprot:scaffold21247_cov45-Attheya_sp.AAC.2
MPCEHSRRGGRGLLFFNHRNIIHNARRAAGPTFFPFVNAIAIILTGTGTGTNTGRETST